MNHLYTSSRATRITRRVAAVLASALITFTLFHEVATLGSTEQEASVSTSTGTQFAQASTPVKTH